MISPFGDDDGGMHATMLLASLRLVHVREQGRQVRAAAGERREQQVVLLRHVPGEQCRDPFRDGGGGVAVRARCEPTGQVRQCVVLGGQRADQVGAAGLSGRRPVEGAFLRLGMGQDLFSR